MHTVKSWKLKNEMKSLGEGEAPEPHKVPGVYCSAGTVTRDDLDQNIDCICKTSLPGRAQSGKCKSNNTFPQYRSNATDFSSSTA